MKSICFPPHPQTSQNISLDSVWCQPDIFGCITGLVAIVYLVLITLAFKHLITTCEGKGSISLGYVFQPVSQER